MPQLPLEALSCGAGIKMQQDHLDKIAFDGVERHCRWLETSGREVVHFIKLLIAQRPFETVAEENMDNAERALTNALQSLQAARDYYKSLPPEKKGGACLI